MTEVQLALFLAPPRQPRLRAKERIDVYEAVLVLRKRGMRVFRSGRRAHTIDGCYTPTEWLLELAKVAA